jgi:hypothetical protein
MTGNHLSSTKSEASTDELKQLPVLKRKPCGYKQTLSGLPESQYAAAKKKTNRSEELGTNTLENLLWNDGGGSGRSWRRHGASTRRVSHGEFTRSLAARVTSFTLQRGRRGDDRTKGAEEQPP